MNQIVSNRILSHSQGYLELGMHGDAWDMLDQLDPIYKTSQKVLTQRLQILIEAKKWNEAIILGKSMCERFSKEGSYFIHTAFALHELKRTQEAKDILLSGQNSLKNDGTFHYNLGCYEAQLGNLEVARENVKRAIELDKKFQKFAIDDPDLEPIWAVGKLSEEDV